MDGSATAQQAVDYVGLMQGALIRELTVTLLFIMNPIPPYLRRDSQRDPESFNRVRGLETKNRKQANEVLGKASERLARAGMKEEAIELKAVPRASDAARDILFEAEHGMYDALVLGHRGKGKAAEMLMGSVTNKVVQHAERLPVWVVGGGVESRKVLCPVDGSEGSLRAVDHLAFMLGENPDTEDHPVPRGRLPGQLLHPGLLGKGPGRGHRGRPDALRRPVHGRLPRPRPQGVGRGRPKARTRWRPRARRAPCRCPGPSWSEVKDGGYGTVVLGRRGENRSFFLGHVSDKVVSKSKDMAVWIVG